MRKKTQVKILDSRIGNTIPLPYYATSGSAGMDLHACLDEDTVIKASETILIPTGISVYVEDKDKAAIILPRSGLGHKHGIVLGNLIGLIDADYQGQLFVSCWNRSNSDYTIKIAERIAQLVIIPIIQTDFEIVDEFHATDRGENGFGSSGTH